MYSPLKVSLYTNTHLINTNNANIINQQSLFGCCVYFLWNPNHLHICHLRIGKLVFHVSFACLASEIFCWCSWKWSETRFLPRVQQYLSMCVCLCAADMHISEPKGKCQLSRHPGGALSSAPSCGEKQYSSDFIDIPLIKAVANPASESNPSCTETWEGRGHSVKLIDSVLTWKLYTRFKS